MLPFKPLNDDLAVTILLLIGQNAIVFCDMYLQSGILLGRA